MTLAQTIPLRYRLNTLNCNIYSRASFLLLCGFQVAILRLFPSCTASRCCTLKCLAAENSFHLFNATQQDTNRVTVQWLGRVHQGSRCNNISTVFLEKSRHVTQQKGVAGVWMCVIQHWLQEAFFLAVFKRA